MIALTGLTAGYVLASYFLLRNPQLLHRRERERGCRFPKCAHISHRGGAGEAYENTLAAFRRAVGLCRTEMLELDVHLTKDGVPVVLHDGGLKRVTGVHEKVAQLSYDQLPPVAAVVPLDFTPPGGSDTFTEESSTLAQRAIPRLEDVFKEFPSVAINIDIKEHDQQLVDKVAALIRRYQREHRTVWGNARDDTTRICGRASPDTGLLFSLRRVLVLLVLYYTGLLPFVPLRETHLEIPMISTLKRPDRDSATRTAVLTVLDAVLMRPALFRHLSGRGIPTYAWVLNTEEEWRRAFSCGISGVMTDYPLKLRHFLDDDENQHLLASS